MEALPRLDAHRPRGAPRSSRRTRWRITAWIVVHVLVLAHIAHWKLAGTTLTPMEPSEAGETLTLGYVNAGFLLFVLLILATLVLGRFFCGWACHVVAYQDACALLLAKLGIRPRPMRSRLLALVPAFAAVHMFVLPLASRLAAGHGFPELALHLETDDLWLRFPGPGIAALTFFVDGALIVYLLGTKGFCTYACPYGAVFGAADRVAPGRIRVTDACEGCGHCTAVCTSNVRVHEEVARHRMVVDSGCMKCLDCVNVCPKDALYFGFRGRSTRPSSRGRARREWDFSWPEELALAAVFAGALYAWRGLYGAIPFLLALGLAVLAAVAAVLAWRCVTRPGFTFQHLSLRDGRGWTARGVVLSVAAVVLLGLTAHGGAIQYRGGRAEELLDDAERASAPAARDAAVAEAAQHLAWIERFALVDTADVANKVGSIHYSRGELDQAERAMRRALELDPGFDSSRIVLADLIARRGDMQGALDQLETLLEHDPTNVHVRQRLDRLVLSQPDNTRARALLERIVAALEADR